MSELVLFLPLSLSLSLPAIFSRMFSSHWDEKNKRNAGYTCHMVVGSTE